MEAPFAPVPRTAIFGLPISVLRSCSIAWTAFL
jgi:hypothetical protein